MNYDEVRPYLETGQIIGVKENKTWLHKLTRIFTKRTYTHVGIIQVEPNGVYLAELNGGRNHKIPMSQLMHKSFDVAECPKECLEAVNESINRWLRFEVPYGFLAFILIGLNKFLGLKVPIKQGDIVCTGFVVNILTTAGWKLDVSPNIDPGSLMALLKTKFNVN